MSCEAIEVGNPVLLLSSPPSSLEEFLHSGPCSSIFSLRTKPQLLHISSPLSSSSTREAFPHLGQRRRIPWRAAALDELVMLLIFSSNNYTMLRYIRTVVNLDLVGQAECS